MTAARDARWRTLAEKAAGRPLEMLSHTTDDGIRIEPLDGRSEDDAQRPWREREAWRVSQRIDHPDPARANTLALLDLEGGSDTLVLVGSGSPFARGFGVGVDRRTVETALAGVELDLISMRLDAGCDTPAAAASIVELAIERRMASAGLDIDIGFDPIGVAARTGEPPRTADIPAVLASAQRAGLAGRPLLADGRPYHEAGAGEARELAAVLATAVAYLRCLEAAGLDLADARDAIAMLLPFDADVSLGIAKARAARCLWARVEAASGLAPKPLRLHAETSWRMMTRYDPWVNVMRATAAAAAAGLGGVDTVTVLPMTLALGLPDDGARRVARNVGRILIDEVHLTKVDDPAAGSGSLEALTARLCEGAWALFQEIETQGGIEGTLRRGFLQADVAAAAERRAAMFAAGQRGLIGTSRFPSLTAPEAKVLNVLRRCEPPTTAGALASVRDAEPFEHLRDRAEAEAAAGTRPAVFVATCGVPAAFGPRAVAAANWLSVAGIAAEVPTESHDVAATTARFADSGTRVACLCGTDEAYRQDAKALIRSLRAAGAAFILMAGSDESWRASGIDLLIGGGSPSPETLSTVLDAVIGSPANSSG